MEETILTKLKEEHRELQMLLLKVERCKELAKKKEYFRELEDVLVPHMEGEEQTLYAKLKNDVQDEDAAEMANLAGFEHQEIKELLAMLKETEFGTPEWDELYSDMKENIQLHVEEEETDLFNEAKEDFSRDELVQIVSDYEEVKSHSHH